MRCAVRCVASRHSLSLGRARASECQRVLTNSSDATYSAAHVETTLKGVTMLPMERRCVYKVSGVWCDLLFTLNKMTRLGNSLPLDCGPRRRRLSSCDIPLLRPLRHPRRLPRLSSRHWWHTMRRRRTRASGRPSFSASSTVDVGRRSSSGWPRRTRDAIWANGYLQWRQKY